MGVKLHVDLETLQLIQGPGQRSALATLRFKRGDSAKLQVMFLENGITPKTIGDPGILEIQIGIKPRNQFARSYLAHSADWTMPSAGDDTPTYECAISFNTLQLDSALNIGSATAEELSEITLMGEITWREGEGQPTSTRTFLVVVENDVNRGTEGIPVDAEPPYPPPANLVTTQTLDSLAVRHDTPQSLSPAAQAQARENLGLSMPAFIDLSARHVTSAAPVTINGQPVSVPPLHVSGTSSLASADGTWSLSTNGGSYWVLTNHLLNLTWSGPSDSMTDSFVGFYIPDSGQHDGNLELVRVNPDIQTTLDLFKLTEEPEPGTVFCLSNEGGRLVRWLGSQILSPGHGPAAGLSDLYAIENDPVGSIYQGGFFLSGSWGTKLFIRRNHNEWQEWPLSSSKRVLYRALSGDLTMEGVPFYNSSDKWVLFNSVTGALIDYSDSLTPVPLFTNGTSAAMRPMASAAGWEVLRETCWLTMISVGTYAFTPACWVQEGTYPYRHLLEAVSSNWIVEGETLDDDLFSNSYHGLKLEHLFRVLKVRDVPWARNVTPGSRRLTLSIHDAI